MKKIKFLACCRKICLLFAFRWKHFFIQIPLRHPQEPVYATNSKKNKGGRLKGYWATSSFRKNLHILWTSRGKATDTLELVDIMQKNYVLHYYWHYLESLDISAYTKVHFKRKLLENYGDELFIFSEDGKPDIATLKSSVNTILRKYFEAPKDIDIHLQKIFLLATAAKLIKTGIKLINTNPKFNPS